MSGFELYNLIWWPILIQMFNSNILILIDRF